LLGTGIIIQIAGAGRGDDGAVNVDVQIVAPAEPLPKAIADAVRALPATRVAPILEDALANDGRGGFGCVAISAPVFLSENEAIDLIEAELKKTGLKWKDLVSVDGLQIPTFSSRRNTGFGQDDLPKTKDGEIDWKEAKKPRLKNLAEGTYTFDLGTEDKSVVVKFLQRKDFDLWNDTRDMSTFRSFDLSWLASEVSDAFKQRADGKPVIIGIFFEPSTYPEKRKTRGATPAQWQDEYAQLQKETRERAKEKLRQQVQHFVEYLKQEGVAAE
jgi:hypothetical protein